jgi:TRAP-type C4-dicarboxylate transport system substrate-binding protein
MLRCLVLILAAVFLLLKDGAHGQGLELKLGHAGGPGSIQDVAALEFAARFNKEMSPLASVRVYGDSALGADTDLLASLKSGKVTLAIVAAPLSMVADEFGIFDMPFLVRGRAHVKRFREPLIQKYLQPAAQAKGYRVLAMWEFGVRHFANNVRPIKGPGDLLGLRLRAPRAKWLIKVLQSYGAKVMPLETPEIYPALRSGKLDGIEFPLPVLCSHGIHKVQKYLSLTSHLYTPAFLVIDELQWQKLPEPIRKALSLHARAIQDWVLDRGEELDTGWLALVKKRMDVNEGDRLAFTLRALPIYQEFASKVSGGKAMIKLIFETDPAPLAVSVE